MKDPVILLHGLAETSFWMMPMAAALGCARYRPILFDYPSTKKPIENLALENFDQLVQSLPKTIPLHFVTHSMGGILLRYYLEKVGIPNIGRVVMMAPDNKGSSVLTFYKNLPFFRTIVGPAGVQSADDHDCFSCKLSDKIDTETGIIAGLIPCDPVLFFTNSWPQDGRVSVESTKIKNMKDHITLPTGHDLMVFDPNAIYQTLQFLRYGRFYRPNFPHTLSGRNQPSLAHAYKN